MGLGFATRRGRGRSDGHVIHLLSPPNPPPFRWDPCSFGSPSFGGKGQDHVRLLRHVNVTVASAVVVEDPSTRDTRYETNQKERRRLPRERDKDQRRINTTQETSPFQTNEKKRNEDGNGGYTLQTQRNTRGRWRSLQGW